jgi:hypothetical protein
VLWMPLWAAHTRHKRKGLQLLIIRKSSLNIAGFVRMEVFVGSRIYKPHRGRGEKCSGKAVVLWPGHGLKS